MYLEGNTFIFTLNAILLVSGLQYCVLSGIAECCLSDGQV